MAEIFLDPLTPEEAKGYIGKKVYWKDCGNLNDSPVLKVLPNSGILMKVFDPVGKSTETDKYRFLIKIDITETFSIRVYVAQISLVEEM